MNNRLLICADLDRTLIPNGPQLESPHAREHFFTLTERPEVTLAYVSGRHRELVEIAIHDYQLPIPDFVIGDVGTNIYCVGPPHEWRRQTAWERKIATDWGQHTHADLKALLQDLPELHIQEEEKQNQFKLSYYVGLQFDCKALTGQIRHRLERKGVKINLIWSIDECNDIGLLDVLPASASKFHAIMALMELEDFNCRNTIFCGDSGNDIEVLASPIPSVLVANSQAEVQSHAYQLAVEMDFTEQLYIAKGDFMGMNGNYSAGMLEGIVHYHPDIRTWLELKI